MLYLKTIINHPFFHLQEKLYIKTYLFNGRRVAKLLSTDTTS